MTAEERLRNLFRPHGPIPIVSIEEAEELREAAHRIRREADERIHDAGGARNRAMRMGDQAGWYQADRARRAAVGDEFDAMRLERFALELLGAARHAAEAKPAE